MGQVGNYLYMYNVHSERSKEVEGGGGEADRGNYENAKTVHILLKAVLEDSSM